MRKFFYTMAALVMGCVCADAADATAGKTANATAQQVRAVASELQANDMLCGMTPQEAVQLMQGLCPALAGQLGDNALHVAQAMLSPVQQQSLQLPSIDLSVFDDVKTFFTQVLPLYVYQMQGRKSPERVAGGTYTMQNIYDAPKDGCFYGVGDARNTYDPAGIDCEECRASGGKVKTNGSYAWGMAMYGDKLYWSTNNNYMCMPGYGQLVDASATDSLVTSCWVCEYRHGTRGQEIGAYGDIVQPRIYEYDTKSGVVRDITPDDTNLDYCQGLRSACYHKGVMFFGGPSIKSGSATTSGSSCFLAYNPATGQFIGSSDMASVQGCQITNVRRWIVVDDVLYCGVGLKTPDGVAKGGILRWNGSLDNPFCFEIVGYVPGDAAELVYHKGRIYAGAWPSANAITGLYRSNPLREGGLTAADATDWECVWNYADYEQNPRTANVTYISVLKSYKGRLVWGMFGNTYGVVSGTMSRFGTLNSPKAIAYMLGSLRSTTLWSSSDFESDDDLELLYGESKMPVVDEETYTWSFKDNGFGLKPRFGRSGYGTLFNCYTWAMTEYNNKLYIGTMDMSDIIEPGLMAALEKDTDGGSIISAGTRYKILTRLLGVDEDELGFDCLVMDSPDEPLKLVSDNGMGNPSAYGIRNMIAYGDRLFIGTANPLNLSETGGWQILAIEENGTTGIGAAEVQAATVMYKTANGFLMLSAIGDENITSVHMADMGGRTVYTATPNAHSTFVDLQTLPKGVYAVTVATPSGKRVVTIANR